MPQTLVLDPLLQYGALGLVAIVVMVSMLIAALLSRSLVKTISSATAGVLEAQRSAMACAKALMEMRLLLSSSMSEARSVMETVRREVVASRCVYGSVLTEPKLEKRPM